MRWAGKRRSRAIAVALVGLEPETGLSDRPGAKPIVISPRKVVLLAPRDSISSGIRLRKVAPLPTIPMADFPSNRPARVGAQIKPFGYSFGAGANTAPPVKPLPSDSNANLVQNRP